MHAAQAKGVQRKREREREKERREKKWRTCPVSVASSLSSLSSSLSLQRTATHTLFFIPHASLSSVPLRHTRSPQLSAPSLPMPLSMPLPRPRPRLAFSLAVVVPRGGRERRPACATAVPNASAFAACRAPREEADAFCCAPRALRPLFTHSLASWHCLPCARPSCGRKERKSDKLPEFAKGNRPAGRTRVPILFVTSLGRTDRSGPAASDHPSLGCWPLAYAYTLRHC